jgi:hypothetical protein
MKRVSLDDLQRRMGPAADTRLVSRALDATTLARNSSALDARDTKMLCHSEDYGERTHNTVEIADDGDELLTRCADCGAVTGRFD